MIYTPYPLRQDNAKRDKRVTRAMKKQKRIAASSNLSWTVKRHMRRYRAVYVEYSGIIVGLCMVWVVLNYLGVL